MVEGQAYVIRIGLSWPLSHGTCLYVVVCYVSSPIAIGVHPMSMMLGVVLVHLSPDYHVVVFVWCPWG